jgi:hypothetical protein
MPRRRPVMTKRKAGRTGRRFRRSSSGFDFVDPALSNFDSEEALGRILVETSAPPAGQSGERLAECSREPKVIAE